MSNVQFIRIKGRNRPYITLNVVEYTLGSMYAIYDKQYKFIKSTHTGYNFLNIQTNKCFLRRAIYPVKPTASWINTQCKKDIELGKLMFTIPGCRVEIFRKLDNETK